MKKLFLVFVCAFLCNLAWENLHSVLYTQYQHGSITELVLLRAAFIDALLILCITAPFATLASCKKYSWLILPLGIVVAVALERWALATGRWSYNAHMPIIPLLSVGLTPTLQLGLLGYISFKLAQWV